jgi:uncharacterized protein (UPF0371 family)
MKKMIYLLWLLPLFLHGIDVVPNIKETEPSLVLINEMKRLDNLIYITEKNLENQKQLREMFNDYQNKLLAYLDDTQNKDLMLQMVRMAHLLLETIKEDHLTQVFDAEFISQLNFFSQFSKAQSR